MKQGKTNQRNTRVQGCTTRLPFTELLDKKSRNRMQRNKLILEVYTQ